MGWEQPAAGVFMGRNLPHLTFLSNSQIHENPAPALLLFVAFPSHGAALTGTAAAMLPFFPITKHMADDRSHNQSQNRQNNDISKCHGFPFLYANLYFYIGVLVFANRQIHQSCQYRHRRNGKYTEYCLTGKQPN